MPTKVRRKRLVAVIHKGEGGYWAEVPALPGCVSEGGTLQEIKANIREAAEGWLEVRAELDAEAAAKALEAKGKKIPARLPKNATPFHIAVAM